VVDDSDRALLPEIDREFLEIKGHDYSVQQVGGELHLVIRGFEFPSTYSTQEADLMVKLPAGYPNAQPDMFWTFPDVKLANGNWPLNGEHHETYGGRSWQRWSRHFQAQWRVGIDSLRTYLAVVRKEIDKAV
jgi:hypothetical protein